MERDLNILHLDDDNYDAELISAKLQGEGLNCVINHVKTKQSYVDELNNPAIIYDIILCDYKVPSFTGLSALNLAKEKHPEIPVIYVTGTLGEEIAVELIRKGATDYILKDRLHRLPEAIIRALEEAERKKNLKLTEESLRIREKQYRNLFENSPVGIYKAAVDGTVLLANNSLINMLGYTSFEELASRYREEGEFASTESRKEFKRLIQENGEVKKFEHIWKKKNGTLIYLLENTRAIKNESGDVLYYEGTIEDKTFEKEKEKYLIEAKEKAEEADKLKTEFLAQISHEIRTPLNAIVSYTNIVKEELKGHEDEEFGVVYQGIESASKRLVRTIDLVLNLSSLHVNRDKIQNLPLDLNSLVRLAAIQYRSNAASKNIDLKLNLDLKKSKILGDEYVLNQILDNLIDNAIKYTNIGEVTLRTYKNNKGKVCIDISDTGIGISEEFLSKLFEPFTQESTGYTRSFEGNGLGLALIKKYIDLIGAEIKVNSIKGKGSTFTVILNQKKN